jgi:hypothetical protein
MAVWTLAAGLAAMAPRVDAQSPAPADAVRGGWVADVEGVRHIFILKVVDTAITGIYCPVDCSDPANLAFVERGTLAADGLRFQILAVKDGVQSRTDVTGRVADGHLLLNLAPQSAATKGPRQLNLQRETRKPAARTVEQLFAARGITSGPLLISGSTTPYVPPGPNEPITIEKLEGLWLWSTGPGKQHFMFRKVGDRILGAVCGPCDNPYSFGPLDNFVARGDTLTFDIVHEDWGIGIEYGPFANHATVTLSHHELHLQTVAQNGPRTVQGDLVLIGPVRTTTR